MTVRPKPKLPFLIFINDIYRITAQAIFGCKLEKILAVISPNAIVNRSNPYIMVVIFIDSVNPR